MCSFVVCLRWCVCLLFVLFLVWCVLLLVPFDVVVSVFVSLFAFCFFARLLFVSISGSICCCLILDLFVLFAWFACFCVVGVCACVLCFFFVWLFVGALCSIIY